MSVTEDVSKQIEVEFRAAILAVLESHGLSDESLSQYQPEPRIKVQVERDMALRLYEYVIIVPVTNKEMREKWNN